MITKTVKMHYCEFCKKKGQRSDIIKKHERGCTNNPNRICGMCKLADEDTEQITPMEAVKLIDVTKIEDNEYSITVSCSIKRLQKETTCPACILAALRYLSKVHSTSEVSAWVNQEEKFVFKDEVASLWAEVNDAAQREEYDNMRYGCY